MRNLMLVTVMLMFVLAFVGCTHEPQDTDTRVIETATLGNASQDGGGAWVHVSKPESEEKTATWATSDQGAMNLGSQTMRLMQYWGVRQVYARVDKMYPVSGDGMWHVEVIFSATPF